MDERFVSVTQINRYIKNKIDQDEHLNVVYLKAEISNFKNHTRGHLYFTLKDNESRISAVMFATSAAKLNFVPVDGVNVLIEGRIGVYEANGGYQVYVNKMTQDGVGNLYLEYEKLKKRLAQEGLFDVVNKKMIPKYPKKIGIITASTGAAVKDIISTIKRRYPIAETILFPSLVQGEGAKEDIVKQLNRAQEYDVDVIICGRGGGSIEDLWAFNEEVVARAIYASRIPIISAVGHEVDFTIADFVADLRAPTPTGAAEMAVPNLNDVRNHINQYKIRICENVNALLKHKIALLKQIKNSYVLKNPMALFEIKEQKLDSCIGILNNSIRSIMIDCKNKYDNLLRSYVFTNSKKLLEPYKNSMALIINKLKILNPLNILESGYSMVMVDDIAMNDVSNINKDDLIDIRMKNGKIKANVIEVEEMK